MFPLGLAQSALIVTSYRPGCPRQRPSTCPPLQAGFTASSVSPVNSQINSWSRVLVHDSGVRLNKDITLKEYYLTCRKNRTLCIQEYSGNITSSIAGIYWEHYFSIVGTTYWGYMLRILLKSIEGIYLGHYLWLYMKWEYYFTYSENITSCIGGILLHI